LIKTKDARRVFLFVCPHFYSPKLAKLNDRPIGQLSDLKQNFFVETVA